MLRQQKAYVKINVNTKEPTEIKFLENCSLTIEQIFKLISAIKNKCIQHRTVISVDLIDKTVRKTPLFELIKKQETLQLAAEPLTASEQLYHRFQIPININIDIYNTSLLNDAEFKFKEYIWYPINKIDIENIRDKLDKYCGITSSYTFSSVGSRHSDNLAYNWNVIAYR